jgi:hypothetical protein
MKLFSSVNDINYVRNSAKRVLSSETLGLILTLVSVMAVILESGAGVMVVKILFGRGTVVSGRPGKNSRLATLAASLLTLVSVVFGSLAMWRIGTDLDWAGDFAFSSGFLSH